MTIYPRINISESPELKDKVRDGSLFIWECPHCGNISLSVFQTLYHDPEEKIMIWLLPKGSVSEDEMAALEAHMNTIAEELCKDKDEGLGGYILRMVNNVGSLIEKVNIYEAGLDDHVVEMCKYVTKLDMLEKLDPSAAESFMSAPFKFYSLSGPDNDITLSYPFEGQMHGLVIGFNVYEDCRGILQRNPAATTGAGFTKVDEEWISSMMR